MTTAAVFWLCVAIAVPSGLLFAVALCRAAARGDAQLAHLADAPALPSPRPALDDTQEFEPIREWGAA